MSENKTSIMANPFVRRLIPVATAAGLSFAACGPTTEDNNTENNTAANNTAMNNMTSANNTAAGNNTSANNASTNNTAANNATTGNSTTPANNTAANSTTPVNNTSANNTSPVNNTTPTNNTTPANNTSPGADGVPDEAEIRAFCQGYSDCDATAFMDSYTDVDDCVTSFQSDISEFAGSYGQSCEPFINTYAESYLLAAECIDGSFTIPEAAGEMFYSELQSELARCINSDGVQIDEAKVTPFCQSYVACQADAFASVDECVNETLLENNAYLGYFEAEYSADCASAFKAYAEDLLNTFTCQDGMFVEGDGNPALAMDLETKCQTMP